MFLVAHVCWFVCLCVSDIMRKQSRRGTFGTDQHWYLDHSHTFLAKVKQN